MGASAFQTTSMGGDQRLEIQGHRRRRLGSESKVPGRTDDFQGAKRAAVGGDVRIGDSLENTTHTGE